MKENDMKWDFRAEPEVLDDQGEKVLRVRIDGELTHLSQTEFRAGMFVAVCEYPSNVVLDLSSCRRIDSTGYASIMEFMMLVHKSKLKFYIAGANAEKLRKMDWYGLTQYISGFKDATVAPSPA